MTSELTIHLLRDLKSEINDYEGASSLWDVAGDVSYDYIIGEARAKEFFYKMKLDVMEVLEYLNETNPIPQDELSYERLVNNLVANEFNLIVGTIEAELNPYSELYEVFTILRKKIDQLIIDNSNPATY